VKKQRKFFDEEVFQVSAAWTAYMHFATKRSHDLNLKGKGIRIEDLVEQVYASYADQYDDPKAKAHLIECAKELVEFLLENKPKTAEFKIILEDPEGFCQAVQYYCQEFNDNFEPKKKSFLNKMGLRGTLFSSYVPSDPSTRVTVFKKKFLGYAIGLASGHGKSANFPLPPKNWKL